MAQLQNTQAAGFNEANLNPLGSEFGLFGNKERYWIQREVAKILTRTWPEMFIDTTLLFKQEPMYKMSDEFEFNENPYDRVGFTVTAATAATAYPSTVTVTVATTTDIAFIDMLVGGHGWAATIESFNPNANTITLKPMTNKTIPALTVGQMLPFVTPVEGDGAKTINYKYRMIPKRKYNYIYLLSGMIEYTMLELQKQQKLSYIPDFLNQEFENLVLHMRNSMSNMFWQGIRGEFTLAGGRLAKSCEGIDEFITTGGNILTTPITSLGDALENAILNSQYGQMGQRKYLFLTPRLANELRKQYKNASVTGNGRFLLSDSSTKLNLELDEYKFGMGTVVIVPFQRFQDTASFPVEYQNFAYLLDYNLIHPVKLANWADTGSTPDRRQGPFLNMSTQRFIADSFSTQNNNAAAHAKIIVQ